jgi:hypothetical protein
MDAKEAAPAAKKRQQSMFNFFAKRPKIQRTGKSECEAWFFLSID